MKKWLITGLVVLALVAAGVSVHWWLRFLPFFRENSDLIQGLSGAIQMVLWLGAGLAFVIGLWPSRKKAQDPSGEVKVAQGVQAGGVNVIGEARVGGDMVGRDNVTINIQQAPVPVSTLRAEELLSTVENVNEVPAKRLSALLTLRDSLGWRDFRKRNLSGLPLPTSGWSGSEFVEADLQKVNLRGANTAVQIS